MTVPFILVAGMTYLFSLSLQNPTLKTPSYVDINFKIDALNAIILLAPTSSLFFFARSTDRRIFAVVIFITLLNFAFLILALLDIHPADIRSKYCIGLLWGNLVFYILMFAKIISLINIRSKLTIALVGVSLGIVVQHNSLSMRAKQNLIDTKELCKLSGKKIFVDWSLSPTVKYLMTFGKARKWNSSEGIEIYFQKQIHHTIGSDGRFLRDVKIENLDLSLYDTLIASDKIILDDATLWKKNSNYIYTRN